MSYFIFDDVDTRSYDVEVYFNEIDSSPKRMGTYIDIPSRNGSFFLDDGRYSDMTHSYSIIATDPSEGKNLINAIVSKVGYHRLEDSFNTDEFYQAVLTNDVQVTMHKDRQALKYVVNFTRKPQRFLKSGETETSKNNNSTITNPTLFPSHPLLKFRSNGNNGTVGFAGQSISVLNTQTGRIPLDLSMTGNSNVKTITIRNTASYTIGDTLTIGELKCQTRLTLSSSWTTMGATSEASPAMSANLSGGTRNPIFQFTATQTNFTAGTSSTQTKSIDVTCQFRNVPNNTTATETRTYSVTIAYNGSDTITVTWNFPTWTNMTFVSASYPTSIDGTVNSTKSALDNVDIYIDLDIGEAYSIDGSNNVVSLNNFVNLGGELPVLPSGNSTITYSNVTNFKITPRWWKI